MMEMLECKAFLGNLSVCEQLSGREKAGKLECSKNIQKLLRFKDVRVLQLKQPIYETRTWGWGQSIDYSAIVRI